jgi:hypothetical protein
MSLSEGSLLAFAALGGVLEPDKQRVEIAPGVKMIAVDGDPVLHHPDESKPRRGWRGLVDTVSVVAEFVTLRATGGLGENVLAGIVEDELPPGAAMRRD